MFLFRHHHKKSSYDPIDCKYIDEIDVRVMEEEESSPPELDYDEIEQPMHVNEATLIHGFVYTQAK